MQSVIEIKWGDAVKSIFVDRIFERKMTFTSLHRHRYAEIHVVTAGSAVYTVENEEYRLEAGMAIIIPSKAFHSLVPDTEETQTITFCIDDECSEVHLAKLSVKILNGFLEQLGYSEAEDTEKAVPYIYWLMSELLTNTTPSVKRNEDYLYLIFEFISKHYNEDIKLWHLAEELHLSEKHIQRIIKKGTDNTFLKELTAQRMKIAEYLNKTTEMSLSEISEYVGYRSYSGFWKAWQKYQRKKEK